MVSLLNTTLSLQIIPFHPEILYLNLLDIFSYKLMDILRKDSFNKLVLKLFLSNNDNISIKSEVFHLNSMFLVDLTLYLNHFYKVFIIRLTNYNAVT